jgi:hypothetical protein
MDATAMFVQFPHPGGEHVPLGGVMPWNVAAHRRKFLIGPGEYLDDRDGKVRSAELVFWSECEPPSRIEQRWPADGRLPRVLHRPYWTQPRGRVFRQNTDPWVFGDRMISIATASRSLVNAGGRHPMRRAARAPWAPNARCRPARCATPGTRSATSPFSRTLPRYQAGDACSR